MGEKRGAYRILVGRPEGRRPFGRPGVDGSIILKWIFKKWDGGMNWIELSQGQVAGCCECGNEPSGSIKCGEFVDWLRNC
jgi:hypothetical protein